ncbi:MAG: efflux RND transporter permease subunit [Acidobacteriota bacterium]
MRLPSLAIERPITTAMLLVSVLLFGVLAVMRLPLAFLPAVDVPFITVVIPYPDSNPQQVEREITKPVEEVLGTLSGVQRMNSVSNADGASVELRFDWGQDLDIVRMQVSEKIDLIEGDLPEEIGEIMIFSFNTQDIPVVEGRISAEGVDLSENYQLLEARVLSRLQRIPGVARVDLDGVAPREIFVDLRLDRVKEHGIGIDRLIDQLSKATASTVLGEVDGPDGRRFTARALGQFQSVDELRELQIDKNGLRLGDVADITFEEPPIRYGRHLDRDEAIALLVFKESTANTVDVVNAVLAALDGEIASDPLLQGISFFMWQNQADQITGALNGLTRSGLIGALLAVVVLYFFLRRLGSTLIVSMSIPFSILAACGMLYFLDMSLNVLSMMGLMLGVGMLVDNAIVVLESIDRRKRTEPDPKKAARAGALAVSTAVLASTATSLIVFLPLILGGRSELTTWLGEIGITIALALVCSLFSSLTLIPLMASRFLRPGTTRPVRLFEKLEAVYAALLAWTLRRRAWTAVLLVAILGVGLLPFPLGLITDDPFSGQVNERLYLSYGYTDFVYKSESESYVDRVEATLEPHLEELGIESVYSFFAANEAGTTLTLVRKDLDSQGIRELRERIRAVLPKLPGVELSFFEDDDSTAGSTSFAFNIYGQDSAVLERLSQEAKRRLETLDGVDDVGTSFGSVQKEIEVTIDRDKAARLDLSASEIAQTFSFVLGSFRLPRFNDGAREVETWLALRLEDRSDLADLKKLQFREVDGRPVTLGDIASFETVDKPDAIERENRRVRARVRASYEGEDWDSMREKVTALMDGFDFPNGYSWSWNARILEQDSQGQQMAVNFLLALVLVYLVMASLFESLTQPFAILFSIPFAVPGAAWLLVIAGSPFNLMSQIGLLILMGIVVNNGIVLLDHLNHLRASGLAREEAVIVAGQDRMRAILMTASTTIIGLIPLALGGSKVGGVFYYPLALTVMGGLVSSSLLTLVVLPSIHLAVEDFSGWLSSLWRRSKPRGRLAAGAARSALEASRRPS